MKISYDAKFRGLMIEESEEEFFKRVNQLKENSTEEEKEYLELLVKRKVLKISYYPKIKSIEETVENATSVLGCIGMLCYYIFGFALIALGFVKLGELIW